MDMKTVAIVITAVVVLIAAIAAIGFFVYRQKKGERAAQTSGRVCLLLCVTASSAGKLQEL